MTKTDRRRTYQLSTDTAEKYSKKKVQYKKTILPNNLRIISEEVPTVESFALGIFINTGSRHDEKNLWGTAHFVEHTTFRQTEKYSFKQLASKFESLGAYFNAYTTKETTCFFVRALKEHFETTLELLSEIAFNPVFLPKYTEKERQIIMEEVKSCEDDLEELSFDYADRLLFGNHAIAYPIIGLQNSVAKIQTDDLIAFHKEFYNAENSIIALAGNIKHEQIVESAMNLTALVRITERNPKEVLIAPKIPTKKTNTIYKSSQQAHLLLGRRVEGLDSDDRYPLSVLNILFGDGMSSRLNQQLRERHGLAYSAYSSLQYYSDCGGFYLYAAGEESNVDKIKDILNTEMLKLTTKTITQSEILRAKEQLKTSVILDLESMSARMEALAKGELIYNDYEDVPATIGAIDNVTRDSLNLIISKYMNPEEWSEILILPKEK